MSIRFTAWVAIVLLPPMAAAQSVIEPPAGERLSLTTAVRLAIEHNRQVQAARLQVAKAETDLAAIRTRRLPSFATSASASQLLTPVEFAFPRGAFGDFPGTGPIPAEDTTVSSPRRPTVLLQSQLTQPLSQLYEIGLNIRGAENVRQIEQERLREREIEVVNAVKRAYFAILQAESALTASEEAIRFYQELERTLDVRVAQKVALRSDALDAGYRLAQEKVAHVKRLNTLASQKEQLNQLLGRDVATPFDVDGMGGSLLIDIDVAAARARAVSSRPDVRQARLDLHQAELDRRLKKADQLPDVSLAVAYTSNFNIDVLPRNMASLGFQVKWEPFDWGRKGRELASKDRVIEQSRLALRDVEDRATLEINSRHRTLAEARATLDVVRLAQGTTREKLRVKSNQYQIQATSLADLLQVRAELAAADDRYQQALLAFWTAKADFERALGEDVIP